LKTNIVDNYHPYTFVNSKGEPDGFSVDIIRAVTKVMELDLTIQIGPWDKAMKSLETGEIDLLPMMAYSRERGQIFDFSVPHTIAYDALFIRKGSPKIKDLESLKGRSLIVMKNDAAHGYLHSIGITEKAQMITVDSLPEALRLLSSGKGDAALMPKLVGTLVINRLGLTNLDPTLVIDAYNRPFSFAVSKGNQALLERLTQGLNIIKATGQYSAIYAKWFGALEPPGLSYKTVLKTISLVVGVFVSLGLILLIWSLSLKKQVALRTRTLEAEIIERKKAEESLAVSEEKYRILFETFPLGLSITDKNGAIIETNRQAEQLVGLPKSEHERRSLDSPEWHILRTDGTPMPKEEYAGATALKENRPIKNIEMGVVKNRGETTWLNVTASPIPLKDYGVAIAYEDISERKRMELQLQESEEHYRSLVEDQIELVSRFRPDGTFLFVNSGFCLFFGLSRDELVGSKWHPVPHPDDLPMIEKQLSRLSPEQPVVQIENRVYNAAGDIRWMQFSNRAFFDQKGDILEIQSVGRDITEQKKAEEKLRTSEAQLSNALQIAHAGHWEYDVVSDTFSFNDNFYKIFRTSAEEVGGYRMSSSEYARRFCHPDDADQLAKETRMAIETTDPLFNRQIEQRILYADGEIGHIAVRFFIIKDYQGKTVKTYGVNQDITEHKRTEEAIRQASSTMINILESISDAFFSMDDRLVVTYFNPAAERLLNRRKEGILGRYLFDAFPEARGSLFDEKYHQAAREKVFLSFETYFEVEPYRNWYEVRVSPQRKGISVYFQVITERKQAEERIKASLTEKEILLKEIHHRVRNNLTTIASILSLQSPYIEDRKAREIFRECENRVRTMSKIHTKLYQSQDFAHIDFGSYLRELSQELFLSYQVDPEAVTFDARIINISLNINTAMPLGLLVTELITNALKYAFPGERKGNIVVSLLRDNSHLVLTVSDNGIGCPEDLIIQNSKTLGLQLVNGLVQQLSGSMEMKRDGGTVWIITFPV
jgi:two-component system, sensor histidine kinase PdtaS